MNFFLVYLIRRFFYRIFEFIRHWYVRAFLIFTHKAISLLEYLDRRLALRITLRYFFKPLYQDYSILGYIFGFIFRSGRVIIISSVYTLVVLVFAAAYLIWVATPPFLIYKIFGL